MRKDGVALVRQECWLVVTIDRSPALLAGARELEILRLT